MAPGCWVNGVAVALTPVHGPNQAARPTGPSTALLAVAVDLPRASSKWPAAPGVAARGGRGRVMAVRSCTEAHASGLPGLLLVDGSDAGSDSVVMPQRSTGR